MGITRNEGAAPLIPVSIDADTDYTPCPFPTTLSVLNKLGCVADAPDGRAENVGLVRSFKTHPPESTRPRSWRRPTAPAARMPASPTPAALSRADYAPLTLVTP